MIVWLDAMTGLSRRTQTEDDGEVNEDSERDFFGRAVIMMISMTMMRVGLRDFCWHVILD